MQDGVSLVQTADGTLNEVQRCSSAFVSWPSSTRTARSSQTDKRAISSEVSQLASEISRIGSTAQFNGIKLFTATRHDRSDVDYFQVGANDGEAITIATQSMGSHGLARSAPAARSARPHSARRSMASSTTCPTQRAAFGAVQNRLQYTLDNLSTYEENLTAALAGIQDVDMASEMMTFTKEQILQQAGTSMLAQANRPRSQS